MVVLFCFSGRCYCQWNVADVFTTTVYCNYDWLMLLPSGRWNSHMLLICFQCCMGRCYCPVADGMATAGCDCFPPGSGKNICHIPLAITSARKTKEDNHLPLGNNICHIPNKAYNICLAITSAIDTIRQ